MIGSSRDGVQLTPLRVLSAELEAERLILERPEPYELCLEVRDRLRARCGLKDVVLEPFRLVRTLLVKILGIPCLQGGRAGGETSDALFGETCLQPLPSPFERAMYGGRRGRKSALQDLKGETHIGSPSPIADRVGAIHLLANVGCHRAVELRLDGRELVGCRIGSTLGEQRRSVETIEFLPGQPPHHIGRVGAVNALGAAGLRSDRRRAGP
jgi:hypothetical protein